MYYAHKQICMTIVKKVFSPLDLWMFLFVWKVNPFVPQTTWKRITRLLARLMEWNNQVELRHALAAQDHLLSFVRRIIFSLEVRLPVLSSDRFMPGHFHAGFVFTQETFLCPFWISFYSHWYILADSMEAWCSYSCIILLYDVVDILCKEVCGYWTH